MWHPADERWFDYWQRDMRGLTQLGEAFWDDPLGRTPRALPMLTLFDRLPPPAESDGDQVLDRFLGHYQLSAPTGIEIGPGESRRVAFVLGQGRDRAHRGVVDHAVRIGSGVRRRRSVRPAPKMPPDRPGRERRSPSGDTRS